MLRGSVISYPAERELQKQVTHIPNFALHLHQQRAQQWWLSENILILQLWQYLQTCGRGAML